MKQFYPCQSIVKLIFIFIGILYVQNVQSQTPDLVTFSPQSSMVSNMIMITGTNLTRVKAIYFGTKKSDTLQIFSNSLLYASVPADAGQYIYAVDIDNNLVNDSVGPFTALPAYPPIISGIDQNKGYNGSTVNISGGYFADVTSVTFGGVDAAQFTVVGPNLIKATIGQGATGAIKVTTATGSVTYGSFAYQLPVPHILNFTPTTASPGITVTIRGNYFNDVNAVTFGRVPAKSFTVVNYSTIQAVVDNGASGEVKVFSNFGNDSLAGFSFVGPPVINSFLPVQAKTGDTIEISGSNFTAVNAVSFGGVSATAFIAVNDNLIKAIVADGTSGDVIVTNSSGSSSLNGLTVISTPRVTSFDPLVGELGALVTVKGTHFTNADRVMIDQTKVPAFTVLSDSVLTFTLDSARSGPITVLSTLNAGVPSANAFAFQDHIEPIVAPSGDNPVSGPLTTKITVDTAVQTYNGLPYVQRHYDVEPANNAANATATLTLYFFQEDFNNYNSFFTQGPFLPSNPNDAAGKANLKIFQYHGFSATSEPGTYDEHGIEIDPDDNNIIWNYSTKLWEVTFDVTGFSGFFIGTNSEVLPLKLLSFNATPSSKAVALQWTTTSEINVNLFEVQKSSDGKQFIARGTVNANGSGVNKTSYSFVDNASTEGVYYYRLKMIDNDGQFGYSKVVRVTTFANNAGVILYPNPASSILNISSPFVKNNISIKLVDVNGKVVKQISVAKGTKETSMDIRGVSSGTYTLIWNNGEQTISKSVLIQ
jgi:hypothetical protein